jgi:hypothetical protein
VVSLDLPHHLSWERSRFGVPALFRHSTGIGRQQDKHRGTAMQVRALSVPLSSGVASSHGRGHRFGIRPAQLIKDDPRVDDAAELIACTTPSRRATAVGRWPCSNSAAMWQDRGRLST